jgi:hypothetical protein
VRGMPKAAGRERTRIRRSDGVANLARLDRRDRERSKVNRLMDHFQNWLDQLSPMAERPS